MKAISIRQPWAWLIAAGLKDIENRTWRTSYRGPILIHAAKGMTRDEYEDVDFWLSDEGFAITLPARETLHRGGIIGVAELVNCFEWGVGASPWHMPGQYGFKLENFRALPSFVPYKGRLGIFEVQADHMIVPPEPPVSCPGCGKHLTFVVKDSARSVLWCEVCRENYYRQTIKGDTR
ncbi:MAG: ASCH domain-containing protein [Burkholderia gladioli]